MILINNLSKTSTPLSQTPLSQTSLVSHKSAEVPAMAQCFVNLPAEIQLRICELLGQTHIRSLPSFALANKHCYSIAKAVLFRTLTFNITTPLNLRKHVHTCTAILRRNDAFHHVRRLMVVGFDVEGFRMHIDDGEAPDDDDDDTSDEEDAEEAAEVARWRPWRPYYNCRQQSLLFLPLFGCLCS